MVGFTMKVGESTNTQEHNRVTVDNKLFNTIQIKDVENYITDDCTIVIDCDTIPFMAAALQDKNTVLVKNLLTDEEEEFGTKTEFKGAARTPGKISQNSWLGSENLKREAEGKELYTLDDFSITPSKILKWDEDKCMENIKTFIDEYISSIKYQSGCKEVLCLIGEGVCHRNKLLLPLEYKSNRKDSVRPLLLKKARSYLQENYTTEVAVGIEADDVSEMYAFKGYVNYVRNGKFNYMLAALDKDARGTPSLLFDYNKDGPIWKNPNPWLIPATNKGVGEIEFCGKECKCTGLMQVCYQLLTGDSIDFFHPYLRFPKDMHPENSYSDASFYKDFVILKTPQECLQKVVDKYFEFFPKGVQYTAWEGTEVDEDTLWWLEKIFTCVYMLRKENDNATIKQLLDHFKVDYKKIVGNNVEKVLELLEESMLRKVIFELKGSLEYIAKKDYKPSQKKGDLVECLDLKVELINQVIANFENLYDCNG